MKSSKILLVDDDTTFCELIGDVLQFEGYKFSSAHNGKNALSKIASGNYDLLLLDLDLPDISGIDVLKEACLNRPNLPIVMVSGQGTIKYAVQAVKLGAHDFIEKPIDAQRLLLTVQNALEFSIMKYKNDRSNSENFERYGMIGNSEGIKKIFAFIDLLAPTNSPVFITGESGTGKELVARAIHKNGNRAKAPFISVNCAAIPETLIESELFGHEKGAFTDARSSKKGSFQIAHQGTIFLDEVGDLSQNAQAKILRILESGEIMPVGSETVAKVDVRVITATNKNLKNLINEGVYREDLFYRINVIPLQLPPLRERIDDIIPLSNYFLIQSCQTNILDPKELLPDAHLILKNLTWNGNVRELKNFIEKLAVLTPSQKITSRIVQSFTTFPLTHFDPTKKETLREAREAFEKTYILIALEEQDWNMTKTAEILDIERSHLYRKVEQLGIKPQ